MGAQRPDIDIDRLLEQAAESTGLDDFGDPSFREGMQRLYEAVAAEGDLNEAGWGLLQHFAGQYLPNRLRVTDWHRRHPGLAAQPVAAPIFIVGPARTGTTALSHLLGADPGNRSIRQWEVNNSVPPPDARRFGEDPRFIASRSQPDKLEGLNPEFRAIHYDPADAPVECVEIMGQHYTSIAYSCMFTIPRYDAWLLQCDMLPAYRYHRQVLQVLQSEWPGRWQLKSPHHCLAMEALHAVYPDARFIVTHRNPITSTASACSLADQLSGTFSNSRRTEQIAQHWPPIIAAMVYGVMDFRERHPDIPFFDVYYDDLVRDPMAVVGNIYDFFGIALGAEAERQMRVHAGNEKQHKHGRHEYSLEQVGLRQGELEERFARYFDHFPKVDRKNR